MNTVLATFIEWAITTAGLAFVLFVCLLSTIGGGHGETVLEILSGIFGFVPANEACELLYNLAFALYPTAHKVRMAIRAIESLARLNLFP
jgi:hypothetical protein